MKITAFFPMFFAWFPVLLFSCGGADDGPEPPNIIIFLVDDLGWADLGSYGSDLHETPHIDRLARQGYKFTNAYSASTVCSPTRAAIMSGKYPARLNLTDWITGSVNEYAKLQVPDWRMYLSQEEETIADFLKSRGYATAHIGKWHLGEDSIYYPQYQGFDVNVAGYSKGSPPSYFYPYERRGSETIPYLEGGEQGEYLTDRLTEEAVTFIKRNRDQPFFLNFDHYSVHTPIQAKDSLQDYYRRKIEPGMQHRNPVYAAMVHSTDESMGRLMATLDSLQLTDNTFIFFASDNGGLVLWDITSNAPLRSGKGSPYEGGTRVPMIIKPTGGYMTDVSTNEPVISMDIYATIRDLLNAEQEPAYEDGLSLLPLLRGEVPSLEREALFWHYPHYHRGGASPYSAIRSGKYKLIEYYEDGRQELFHLGKDLSERENLSEEEEGIRKQLQEQLHRWREEVQAQLPTPNPGYDSLKAMEYYP